MAAQSNATAAVVPASLAGPVVVAFPARVLLLTVLWGFPDAAVRDAPQVVSCFPAYSPEPDGPQECHALSCLAAQPEPRGLSYLCLRSQRAEHHSPNVPRALVESRALLPHCLPIGWPVLVLFRRRCG